MVTPVPVSLHELSETWDAIAGDSGGPMQQFMWASACAAHFSTPADLHVVTVGSRTQPTAVAPLVKKGKRLPRLELLGVEELQEPMDLVYRSAADAEALVSAIASLGLPVFLNRVPADSATVTAFTKQWRGAGLLMVRPAPLSLFLHLDERWAGPEPPLDARRRSDLRRARRHGERTGPVSTRVLSPSPAEMRQLFDEFLRVEAAGWKGRANTALACDTARCGFFRQYTALACQAGTMRVAALNVGDRVAAMQLTVERGGRLWVLKVGFDEAFRHASPGMLLMADVLRWSAQRGLHAVEFLGVPEPWVEVWTSSAHQCVSLEAYPARASGMVSMVAEMVERGRRKLAHLVGVPS